MGACEEAQPDPTGPQTPKTTSGDIGDSETEIPSGNPPKAQQRVVPSIASARLVQDCPDAKTASAIPAAEAVPAPKMSAKRRRKAADASGESFRQPCTQSSVQLAFTGTSSNADAVALTEIRLLTVDGKALGTLSARSPSHWDGNVYVPWDGKLTPNSENKASYKLSIPDWSAVEAATGKGSYETMYVLEADVDIAGTVTTVRSPQFERGRPQIIRT